MSEGIEMMYLRTSLVLFLWTLLWK